MLEGISLAQYAANETTNAYTLSVAIAECMTGVTSSDVTAITATAAARRSLQTQTHKARPFGDSGASADSISIAYVVSSNAAGASYSSLTSQLTAAVADGTFDTDLHNAAIATGATALTAVTSSAVSTTDSLSDDSGGDDDHLSTGIIVGIAVGGAVVLALLAMAVYWFTCRKVSASPAVAVNTDHSFVVGSSTSKSPLNA